ncbi:MAG: DUF6775 family putative metallopeptidase [Pseudomonadota bacterium]
MHVYLYDGAIATSLDLAEIGGYARSLLRDARVEVREDFTTYCLSRFPPQEKEALASSLALRLARTKVRDLTSRRMDFEPLPGEIEYERKRLLNPSQKSFGILYDGLELQKIYLDLTPVDEQKYTCLHIIFTNQLFGTWDYGDHRYHARVSICSFPSILSSTGIVEAPAKPREFYLRKQMGVDYITLKREFSRRFIDYDDPRLTEVMKGYVMQAVFFHLRGEPFCEDPNCRLFNAHWQEEVIRAQIESEYEFCEKHTRILEQI